MLQDLYNSTHVYLILIYTTRHIYDRTLYYRKKKFILQYFIEIRFKFEIFQSGNYANT